MMNINDNVRVQLTDDGRRIHHEDGMAFRASCPAYKQPYRPPKEDADGWSKWQLWYLMQLFGPHMNMGCKLPFKTELQTCEALKDVLEANYIWPNLHTAVTPDPAHAHTVRRYKVGTEARYAVEGPGGYYRDGYHQQAEADAAAAFWSGDKDAAEEHRKAFLVQRGLLKDE